MRSTFKAMVEKIVKSNDQSASLYLQQQIKTESDAIKNQVIESMMPQVLSLVRNRFGNFLIQCALEFGSQHQIKQLGMKMKGHVVQLACDRFGCHVMQKAIERVDEHMKLDFVEEMFQGVQDTLTHRFSCHVWQRIFEIKWKKEKTDIMKRMHKIMNGQWPSIANDENGSLVVQCIFENCSESNKQAIVQEMAPHTLEIAKGQWGNWVIQHLLDHGTVSEQEHIMEVVLQHAYSMSIDQYASKVVEKSIKVSSKKSLALFIEEITKPIPGGPHILQMMNHQFGNYVVQNIISIADTHQRNICVKLLVPHLNVLKGSKHGQRVASLCEKYLRSQKYV
ncbi:armadillo-type protein [Gorgonomyces haynaldii]|nr:armadillo-type protein [Gorgonomyces haynaldii]